MILLTAIGMSIDSVGGGLAKVVCCWTHLEGLVCVYVGEMRGRVRRGECYMVVKLLI